MTLMWWRHIDTHSLAENSIKIINGWENAIRESALTEQDGEQTKREIKSMHRGGMMLVENKNVFINKHIIYNGGGRKYVF